MTQKWYLRNFAPNNAPSAEQSSTLPVGTANSATSFVALSAVAVNNVQVASRASLAQTGQQSGMIKGFASGSLAAGTYGSGTWTLAIGLLKESNVNANAFLRAVVYFWRPSTSGVVGYVYDGTADLGTEWPTTAAGQVVTFTGSDVTILGLDVLVLEVWYVATQGAATSYTDQFSYNGNTDVTAGATAASAGSYLQAPADIPAYVGKASPPAPMSRRHMFFRR